MIDARKFSFSKFTLPRTKPILSKKTDSVNDEIAFGCFDTVNVTKIDTEKMNQSFSFGDKILSEFCINIQLKPNDSEDSRQHILAFTNEATDEIFTEENFAFSSNKLNTFWDSCANDTNLLYYSLLHINVNDRKNIYRFIKKLNKLFNHDCEEYRAVFYFSFDYSDIIICAKDFMVTEYANKIFKMNYFEIDDECNCCDFLKDSFSLFTINHNTLKLCFDKLNKHNSKDNLDVILKEIQDIIYRKNKDISKETLQLSYSIGVQDYTVLEKLLSCLDEYKFEYELYNLLGRQDVSLCSKSKTDLSWLVFIMYYVEYILDFNESDEKREFNLKAAKILFNFESIARIEKSSKTFQTHTITNPNTLKLYDAATKMLTNKIDKISRLFDEKFIPKETYMAAIFSLRNSIVSNLKNRFADDFIVCIYESFVSFLDYIDVEISKSKDFSVENLNFLFNNYFDIISSLVNSVMHSDRQFIQAPSFSPVFFDVPPKLIAFYTSLTNLLVKINKDSNDTQQYSFVFRPQFSNNISVSYFSFEQEPPTDRLISVSINEESLYRPSNVLSVLCHEVAHYVGDSHRCRVIRKELFLKACLFYMFKLAFSKIDKLDSFWSKTNAENLLSILIKEITKVITETAAYKNSSNYFESINVLIKQALIEITSNPKIKTILNLFIIEHFSTINNPNIIYKEIIDVIKWQIQFILPKNSLEYKTHNLLVNEFNFYYRVMLSVFSEIYADVQMVLLMDLTFEEYIEAFVSYEKLTCEKLLSTNELKTFYRIFNIVYIFVVSGIWELDISKITNTEVKSIAELLSNAICYHHGKIYHKSISPKKIKECKEKISKENRNYKNFDFSNKCKTENIMDSYINSLILMYINDVIIDSCQMYLKENKIDNISSFRKAYEKISKFENIVDVFSIIQNTNEKHLHDSILPQSDIVNN